MGPNGPDPLNEGSPPGNTLWFSRLWNDDIVGDKNASPEFGREVHRRKVGIDGALVLGRLKAGQITRWVSMPKMNVDGVEVQPQFPKPVGYQTTETRIVEVEVWMVVTQLQRLDPSIDIDLEKLSRQRTLTVWDGRGTDFHRSSPGEGWSCPA